MAELLEAGSEFAGYRIERLLGRGGFGAVYLAESLNPHLPRKVALKVLAAELSADERFRERFLREGLLLMGLEGDPRIVTVYDAGEHEGRLYFAMRYVDGTDLRTVIDRDGPLAPPRAAAIVEEVASALDVAHAAGLVHRDVKPANVLLSADLTRVYLADFGLGKRFEGRGDLTVDGQFVGTLTYAAPEQIEGRAVDPRTDVYQLGCLLFECLTGQPPFTTDVMRAHLTQEPPAPTALRPELPPGVDAVTARALAKRPEDRFPTCGDLVAATTRALDERDATVVGEHRPAAWAPGPAQPPPVANPSPPPGAWPETPPPGGAWPPPPGHPSGPGDGGNGRSGRPKLLPILLAVAAVLVVGAVAAVLWFALGDDDEFPNADEERVLEAVPAAVSRTCERDAETRRDTPDATAAVRCSPRDPGVHAVTLVHFRSSRAADEAYEDRVEASGAARDSDDECSAFRDVEHAYETAEGTSGRVLCFVDDGQAFLAWTTAGEPTLAIAERIDEFDRDLYLWWSDLVGVESPVDEVEALVARVPEPARGACEPLDAGDFDLDALEARAAIQCLTSLPGEPLVQYVQFASAAAMRTVYERLLADGVTDAGIPPSCPTETTWSTSDREGRVVCQFFPGGVEIIWTDDTFDVITAILSTELDVDDVAGLWQRNVLDLGPPGG